MTRSRGCNRKSVHARAAPRVGGRRSRSLWQQRWWRRRRHGCLPPVPCGMRQPWWTQPCLWRAQPCFWATGWFHHRRWHHHHHSQRTSRQRLRRPLVESVCSQPDAGRQRQSGRPLRTQRGRRRGERAPWCPGGWDGMTFFQPLRDGLKALNPARLAAVFASTYTCSHREP